MKTPVTHITDSLESCHQQLLNTNRDGIRSIRRQRSENGEDSLVVRYTNGTHEAYVAKVSPFDCNVTSHKIRYATKRTITSRCASTVEGNQSPSVEKKRVDTGEGHSKRKLPISSKSLNEGNNISNSDSDTNFEEIFGSEDRMHSTNDSSEIATASLATHTNGEGSQLTHKCGLGDAPSTSSVVDAEALPKSDAPIVIRGTSPMDVIDLDDYPDEVGH